MNPAIQERLDRLIDRAEELNGLLSQPEVINNQNEFRKLSQEYAEVSPVVSKYEQYRKAQDELDNINSMLKDSDADMRAMAQEELPGAEQKLQDTESELQTLLLPRDPNDQRNVFLEIRAGTGGDEASLFAADLFSMYSRYAEQQGWKVEVVSSSESDVGGYKEIISRIAGTGVYSKLKFESGAHRVQRVPTTETQGRIHTSACTVAVMPEAEEVDHIDLTRFVHPGPVASTSTKPIPRFVLRTCRPASLSSARTSAHSTRTRRVRCRYCRPGCWTPNKASNRPSRPPRASSSWAAAIARSEFVPIIFHRVG